MSNDYANFREIIRDIIKEEIQKYFKQNAVEKKYGGTVIAVSPSYTTTTTTNEDGTETTTEISPYEQRCAVDLGFTIVGSTSPIEMILNKSGELLRVGDSVSVYGNASGSFVNSYIGLKHSPIN